MKIKNTLILSAIAGNLSLASIAGACERQHVTNVEDGKEISLTQDSVNAVKRLVNDKVLVINEEGMIVRNEELSLEEKLIDLGVYSEKTSSMGTWCVTKK